jgi:hypothetical protein
MSADQNSPLNGSQPAGNAEGLPEEAKKLLEEWEPGKPIPGGTFYHGLGARRAKPLIRDRTQEERELGL